MAIVSIKNKRVFKDIDKKAIINKHN